MRECKLWSIRPCFGLKSSSSTSTGCPCHAIQRHIAPSFRHAQSLPPALARASPHAMMRAVDLRPGENVLFEGRPAWRALLSFYIWGLLIAAVAGVLVGG